MLVPPHRGLAPPPMGILDPALVPVYILSGKFLSYKTKTKSFDRPQT